MKKVRVVAAIIKAVNEDGDSPQEALVREIKEELETEILVGELIDTIEYDYPIFHLSMDCFWTEIVSGELVLTEHAAAKWLTKKELDSVGGACRYCVN